MERTRIGLGGIELGSSIMNASGPRSAERGELYELSAVHTGAVVFKSCNLAGLEQPENLKNRGVDYYAAIARELVPRGKIVIASVVGAGGDEIVEVARRLDCAGVKAIELNLADDYVISRIAPFASTTRLEKMVKRVRRETRAVLAVKLPPNLTLEPRAVVDILKSSGAAILVCANNLPKDLEVDPASGIAKGPARDLSQVHAYYHASAGALDIVAVGGVNGGRDAYIAHLTGAKGIQIGSALIKEGAGALGRIDRELDAALADAGKASVAEIVGKIRFEG